MPYKYVPHTADVIIEATGKDFGQALEDAAQGLFEFIADVKGVKGTVKIVIKEKAPTKEDLVTFVLSRLLSEAGVNELFFTKFRAKKIIKTKQGYSLEGEVFGIGMSPELGRDEVKAVTHHLTSVEEKAGKTIIRVLLDI